MQHSGPAMKKKKRSVTANDGQTTPANSVLSFVFWKVTDSSRLVLPSFKAKRTVLQQPQKRRMSVRIRPLSVFQKFIYNRTDAYLGRYLSCVCFLFRSAWERHGQSGKAQQPKHGREISRNERRAPRAERIWSRQLPAHYDAGLHSLITKPKPEGRCQRPSMVLSRA